MFRRVKKACGERADGITLTTFHSFCEAILKEGAPGRLPLEQVDHWILLRRNMRKLQLDKYRRLAEPGQFLTDFIQFFRAARTNWFRVRNIKNTRTDWPRNWKRSDWSSTKRLTKNGWKK